MLALLLLPVSDWKSDTKRHRVKDVLVMMRDPVHLSLLFNAAMDHSGFNAGVSFKSMLWRQLVSMIEVAQAWQELGAEARGLVWSDPWAWSDFLTSVSGATPTNRAELAYLRHPATFLPIISGPDKAAIRDAYSDEVDVLSGDLDRDLLAITLALQQRVGGPVEYYDTPFVERWRGGSEPAPTHRAWLVRGSSVRGVDLVSSWLDEAFVSLAASQLPALDLPAEPSTLRAAVDEGYGHLSYAKREEKIRDLRAFLISMRPDDLVLTTSGGRVHVGTVTGEAEQVDSEGGLANLRRAVDWADETAAHDFADLPAELASRLRGSGDVADLTEVIGSVEALLPPPPGPGPKPHPEPTPVSLRHLTVDESEALLVSPTWLDDLVDLLNAKRQVILYGPPGTGKTYLAQKVAAAVAGQNYRLVQFHPAYSYEDFFEGYRPVKSEGGQVAFALKPGPFRRIVDDALERPDEPFLLIIDEINRGNLASVFGELYFLLEYRDEAIRLLYAEDDATTFVLPKNVYLIGTMNTADRSIALVDTAMRRRFAFLSLHPDDPHLAGLLPTWLLRHDLPVAVADLWVELNRRIPDAEFKIGPSYLMSPAVGTDQGLELIWRTSILPLLEEFHYGDGTDVGKQYGLAALRAALDPASEPSPVVADLEANEPEHD
jgi:5-methylcytosine-specific restriction protein B